MEFIISLFFLFFMALMFLFPFLIIGLGVFLVIRMKKKQSEGWARFAREAGLAMDAGSWMKAPTINGVYNGFNVYLYTYTTGSGKNRTTWTSLVVYLPIPNRSHVRVTREGFLSKITKAFGAQDIHIGDPGFDQAYIIKSDTPEYVQRLLTPQIRGALLNGGDVMNFTVSKGTVFYNQQGVQTDAGMLRYILDTLVMVAREVVTMETPQGQAPPTQPAQAVAHPPPVTVCDNCGADLEWEADSKQGVARCEYCGKEMTFQFGNVRLRGN